MACPRAASFARDVDHSLCRGRGDHLECYLTHRMELSNFWSLGTEFVTEWWIAIETSIAVNFQVGQIIRF